MPSQGSPCVGCGRRREPPGRWTSSGADSGVLRGGLHSGCVLGGGDGR